MIVTRIFLREYLKDAVDQPARKRICFVRTGGKEYRLELIEDGLRLVVEKDEFVKELYTDSVLALARYTGDEEIEWFVKWMDDHHVFEGWDDSERECC